MASIKTIDSFSDKDIERLEKIKQLIKEIKEIDNNFSLSNVINADKDTILIVTTNQNYCKHHINFIENDLRNRIGLKCILIPEGTKIDKAINIGIDCGQEKDYTTICEYQAGVLVKEETTQYK